MQRMLWCLAVVAHAVSAEAQISTLSMERLDAGTGYRWTSPCFGPDGTTVYYSREGYRGIWELQRSGGPARKITDDRGAGYGFVLSGDGKQIVYRRTSIDAQSHRRWQEIVLVDLTTDTRRAVSAGRSLSLPAYVGGAVVYSAGKNMSNMPEAATSGAAVLGIESTKIALVVGGTRRILDPLGGGRYIWPSLSPDGTRLLAVDMEQGAFVCDLQGRVLLQLGKRNAPAWTRDGRWIVYMDDRDDGHATLSSDLYAVSADGKATIRLTDTPDIREMYPACSPTDNAIVCSSLEGDLYLLTYGEE